MKRLIRLLILAVIVLIGILILNTLRTSSKQLRETPVHPLKVSDQALERLSQGIQMATVSVEGPEPTAPFLALDTLLRKQFPLLDSLLERQRFAKGTLLRWQGKNARLEPVLLLAHLDVVPVEPATRDEWTHAPFSGAIKDGFVWGRGTLDDKAMAYAILEAIEMMIKQKYQPNRTIMIALGEDEEIGGIMGAQKMAHQLQKEGLRFAYILDEAHLIIEDALSFLPKPLAMIGIAEKGFTTLTLTARVNGGHSSMPPKETAVGVLSKAIYRLESNPLPATVSGATRQMFEYVGPEVNPPYNVLFANMWLTKPLLINILSQKNTSNALIRTTTAPTMVRGGIKDNVLPKQASAKVNFRIIPGETPEDVVNYVQQIISDERVIVQALNKETDGKPSPISDTDSFGFNVLQRTITQVFPDVVVAPALVIAFTDSRHYQALSDQIYRFMPVQLKQEDLTRIHGIDERISTESYKQMIRFYHQLILNSCN